jgi:cytidine deaminase
MKELKLTATLTIIEDKSELSDEELRLVEEAKSATDKAYAPYSNFFVGCAIQTDNGHILSGGNQENASYPACICAENITLAAARSQFPNEGIKMMAIATRSKGASFNPDPVAPCGVCRQSILEHQNRSGHPIIILLIGGDGSIIKSHGIEPLLPLSFSSGDLPKSDK